MYKLMNNDLPNVLMTILLKTPVYMKEIQEVRICYVFLSTENHWDIYYKEN